MGGRGGEGEGETVRWVFGVEKRRNFALDVGTAGGYIT